jgi:N,N-dimethylformamidase
MRDRNGHLSLRLDPSRLDLAAEFKARPFGGHSPALQDLLNLMRSAPIEGKHFLYMTKPHREWTLARMSAAPPLKPILVGPAFTRIEDAEWHVFKLRWQALSGQALAID